MCFGARDDYFVGFFDGKDWVDMTSGMKWAHSLTEPSMTHWMKLPDPPEGT
jgi:hypothetical protein